MCTAVSDQAVGATAAASPGPIALLGGTFDPIHFGHLQLARDALTMLNLAQVRFVPAGQPWQKNAVSPAHHRLAMVELALAAEPEIWRQHFGVETCEIHRDGPSYTVDTLAHLRREIGEARPLVLLIGSDQLERLDSWRQWHHIVDLAHLVVARRDGAELQMSAAVAKRIGLAARDKTVLQRMPAGAWMALPMTPMASAASILRAHFASVGNLRHDPRLMNWLPEPVLNYIEQHHLYK